MTQKQDFNFSFNDLRNLVPRNLRNTVLDGLLDNLFNRQLTKDESVPFYGFIGKKSSSEKLPLIPQLDVERDINAITPILHFKLGSEEVAFTVNDLIRRAETLGINAADMNWLYSQAHNFAPPISIDKFANYYNYFWVAKALAAKPTLSWNLALEPEYYCIARPQPRDLDKANVEVATTSSIIKSGSGFVDQIFNIKFTNANTFVITATSALGLYYAFGENASSSNNGPESQNDQYTFSLSTDSSQTQHIDTFVFQVRGPAGDVTLLTFSIVRDTIYDSTGQWVGNGGFAAGDEFVLTTSFLSSTYQVSFTGSVGVKGKIANVKTLAEYQTIDGVKLESGFRVLVKDNSPVENGIYVVGPQGWSRASDYSGVTLVPGARVWVKGGTLNAGKLFTSGAGNSWPAGVKSINNTNDWQEGNFWVHGDDLAAYNLSRSDVVQAVRPIIEYRSDLQLNSRIADGVPTENIGVEYRQTKTRFNQLPMFNLYRYDGTHSGKVSSTFYYVEDITADLDTELQRRVKLADNDSADYLFAHGLADNNGLLFVKIKGQLKSIWHAGYTEASVSPIKFTGAGKGSLVEVIPSASLVAQDITVSAVTPTTFSIVGSISGMLGTASVGSQFASPKIVLTISYGEIAFDIGDKFTFSISEVGAVSQIIFDGTTKGKVSNLHINTKAQQQVWFLTAESTSAFKVSGSKTRDLPDGLDRVVIGRPYANLDFSLTIEPGGISFEPGDEFVFAIGNIEMPRYVYRADDGVIVDFYGGKALDTDGVGAYQTARSFAFNPYNDSSSEIQEGHLYSHFRSILANQGNSEDFAFGGTIKGWSELHTLLASLLMQKDLTPISMIDFAKREYENALNAVADIFKQNVVQYIATNGASGLGSDQSIVKLADSILALREVNEYVRTVFNDSTAGVKTFPITLPLLGISPAVKPAVAFDNLLGHFFITHHDGHNSVLAVDDIEFRRSILNDSLDYEVSRSDGSITKAIRSLSDTPVDRPYRGELWLRKAGVNSEMFVFDVTYDAIPASANVGDTFYERATDMLFEWSGFEWLDVSSSKLSKWRQINIADLLNHVILEIETRLYNAVNNSARKVNWTPLMQQSKFKDLLKSELFAWSAANGLVALGSDYRAGDAFSWNYRQATTMAQVATSVVPARWYNVLMAHQATVPGIIPTARPNREPWCLFGFDNFTSWWDSLSSSEKARYTPAVSADLLANGEYIDCGVVDVVKTEKSVTQLFGLQIIDGFTTRNGSTVLLQNEVDPINNGIWVASAGNWVRDTRTMSANSFVVTMNGLLYKDTIWTLMSGSVSGVDSSVFAQARLWSDALWQDIIATNPTLKLSVDTVRDGLLPPYVSPSSPFASLALTNVIPSGTASGYEFLEGGPVETVWMSSVDFGYSLAKSLFKIDPLAFLSLCWGFAWVEVDGVFYDAATMELPGHKRFALHGSSITPRQTAKVVGTLPFDCTLTYDAYEVSGVKRYQNFSVKVDGKIVDTIRVNEKVSTLAGVAVDFAIYDEGIPFAIGDSLFSTAGTSTFIPASTKQINGFAQIFAQCLKASSIDTTSSYAINAFNGYEIDMCHRVGSLASSEDLSVTAGSVTLDESSYTLMLKKNPAAKDIWVHALRITVENTGSSKSSNGVTKPATDASDWTFIVDGYNPRYNSISYYEFDASGPFVTFNVLDRTETTSVWKHHTKIVDTVTTALPLRIVGLQNVIRFLFGYETFLSDVGYEFNQEPNSIDAETGRVRCWQLDVEKLIVSLYRGVEVNRGLVFNSFMDAVWVRQDFGLLDEFEDQAIFDVNANPAVFDVTGAKIRKDDVSVNRGNMSSRISSNVPMFSIHSQLAEYEHVFIFNRFAQASTKTGLLYEPFTGSRAVSYQFKGRRQVPGTFRPEFGGYFISDGKITRNIQNTVASLSTIYDANTVFESGQTSKHALSLLGFNKKDYFTNINITDKAQFNFWRGLVQAKGTNMSIDAYLNCGRLDDAKVDEFWAFKVAEYGDARQKSAPELKLLTSDATQQYTKIQFNADTGLAGYVQVSSLDETRWNDYNVVASDFKFAAKVVGTLNVSASVGDIIQLPFVADQLGGAGFEIINHNAVRAISSAVTVIGYGQNAEQFSPIKLINYAAREVVEDISLWHPAAGYHNPDGIKSINIISNQNPARFNYSLQASGNNSYDPLRPWGEAEIGRTWFDTTNLAYIPYFDTVIFDSVDERLSRWGAIADFASVDVYEWVKSTVSPAEYNALSLKQAGDRSIDETIRADGQAALETTYIRTRNWMVRPIAWSRSTKLASEGHPSFTSSFSSRLWPAIGKDTWSLDAGLFSDSGIVAGSRIGVWNNDPAAYGPLSEAIVTDTFTKEFVNVEDQSQFSILSVTANSVSANISLTVSKYTDLVGNIEFVSLPIEITPVLDSTGAVAMTKFVSKLKVIQLDTMASAVVELLSITTSTSTPPTHQVVNGEHYEFDIASFGITVSLDISTSTTSSFDILGKLIAEIADTVFVRDAVKCLAVVEYDLPEYLANAAYFNGDSTIPAGWYEDDGIAATSIGWRAWQIPSQAALSADGMQPNAEWKPYFGPFSNSTASADVIAAAIAEAKSPLSLTDGTLATRYTSSWSAWENVLGERVKTFVREDGDIAVTLPRLVDAKTTTVYVNGLIVPSTRFTLSGFTVLVSSVIAGDIVTIDIRKYEPSADELAFNPDVEDDLTYQHQYRKDYEYVVQSVRDLAGSITSKVYYFWVKNRSIVSPSKSMSVQAIAKALTNGPSNFLTFQNISDDHSYDSIAIAGLSYLVMMNDTFSLRFLRDFTLRDNPENLSLKNTHAEWTLIRPGQKRKIPEALWTLLVNTIVGEDLAGNAVPSAQRISYDFRNGTKTRFGFNEGQALADRQQLIDTVTFTIINTKLVNTLVPQKTDGSYESLFIAALDFSKSNQWFATPSIARETMGLIWTTGTAEQINEIFFNALEDIVECNYEMTHLFKTSRLSAYSVKVIQPAVTKITYE